MARTFAVVRRAWSAEDANATSEEHNGRVYEIIREQNGRFWIGEPEHQFNIAPDEILNVGELPFGRGDRVRVVDGRVARIVDCVWHYKKQQPMYFLAFDDKKSSRRYFPDELSPAE